MAIAPAGTIIKGAQASGSGVIAWGGGNSPVNHDLAVAVCSSDNVSSVANYIKLATATSEIFNGAYLFYRMCDGTSNDNISLSAASGPGVIVAARFSGVDPVTPLDATSGSSGHNASTSTGSASPSSTATPGAAGKLVVGGACLASLQAHDPTGTGTWTDLTAAGEQKTAGTAGADQFVALAYKLLATTSETFQYSWTAGAVDYQTAVWATFNAATATGPVSYGGGFFA